MLPDIRLDFINKIKPVFIEMMTDVRVNFIGLDDILRQLSDMETAQREGVIRCLSIARENLETACQYTIKSLCIMGEDV